ncbi:MAG TPA: hypothetical protein VFS58_05795 [Steroidobacteraceae bacterium]|nr:hypothetical protein [Steroidobacteraceae bacterium]
MRGKPVQLTFWTLGILLSAMLYVNASLLSRSGNWAWLALTGILFLLAAIALGARRHLPFGGRV